VTAVFDHLRSSFDHTEPDHAEHMHDQYEFLRDSCPVAHSEKHGGFWVLSRYDDIREALQQPDLFASGQGITIPPIQNPLPGIPTESDAPMHAHYRGILWPFLTAQAVASYEPLVRDVIDGIFAQLDLGDEIDVIKELAQPIPAVVIGIFFGLGADDGLRCFEWINTMIATSVSDPDRAMQAGSDLFSFLADLVKTARETGAEGVLAAVVRAEVDGTLLSEEECIGMLFTAIGGALETTASAIAQTFYLVGADPGARRRLQAEPELIPRAVEEVLRIASPAHCPARTLTRDTTIGGTEMRKGDRVLLLLGSANQDESRFELPRAFQVDRAPNQHLTFGSGVHKCAGQHLARLELRVVLTELLQRIPEYEIVGDPRPTMRGGATVGLDDLRIRIPN
jgi:cytochrome P450